MDPSKILFSVPTLCDSTPPTEDAKPSGSSLAIHEDDWRQVEFVANSNLTHIQRELESLSVFKREHRQGAGWKSVYLRKEHPIPFLNAGLKFSNLPALTKSALVLGSGPPWEGVVAQGFALSDEGDWFLYGHGDKDRIVQLAVSTGLSTPSQRFARVISQLTQAARLLLVDWQAVALVDTTKPESVLVWASRYQRG